LIFPKMPADKGELRTEFARLPSRHAAADPEGLGFVGSGKHNPTTDGNGFAAQRRVKQLLYGGIESIQVRMEDGGCRCHPDRSPMMFRRDSRKEEHNENKDDECQAIGEDRSPYKRVAWRASTRGLVTAHAPNAKIVLQIASNAPKVYRLSKLQHKTVRSFVRDADIASAETIPTLWF